MTDAHRPYAATPMPQATSTRRRLTAEMDGWWESLTPGQRLTVYLTADTHAPRRGDTRDEPDPEEE